jgi:hypothetical protein
MDGEPPLDILIALHIGTVITAILVPSCRNGARASGQPMPARWLNRAESR